jgi:hypothetical protein
MPRRTDIAIFLIAAALAGCASDGWDRLQREFPQAKGDCRLHGTLLQRDSGDNRLLRLVFLHRNNEALQARTDGRVACLERWARERGWRVTTAPEGKGT